MARLFSQAPARRFGQYPAKGVIATRSDADFTIVDMREARDLHAREHATRSGHTSWEGIEVTAMPVYTIVRGETVMEQGRITGKPGYGRMLQGKGGGRRAVAPAGSAPLPGME